MIKNMAIVATFLGISAQAYANPYVAGRVGFSDLVVDTTQYMYHTPDAFRSTIVDGKINDINAAYHAAIGYDFGLFRVEAEYSYSHYVMSGNWALNTKNLAQAQYPDVVILPPNLSYPATYTLTDRVHTVMANAYYNLFRFGERYTNSLYTDINIARPCCYNSVYIMGGIGMARLFEKGVVDIDTTMAWGGEPLSIVANTTINRFVSSLGVGLNFGLTKNISADLGYKYTNLGNFKSGDVRRDYWTHELMLGLRYEF